MLSATAEQLPRLVQELNFKEKVDRSMDLLSVAYRQHGEGLVVAHSLGKDSSAVWHLAKHVSSEIRGFVVTTPYKPHETKTFMWQEVERYPELTVFSAIREVPDGLYATDPDQCCEILKVGPTRRALAQLNVTCWVTGLRCTEGRTRRDFLEVEERDPALQKLNPILLWSEREVWQYLALHRVRVNPLYHRGYRSLGCWPCTRISTDPDERAGRWIGTSKCGGECGIHTRPMKLTDGAGI